MKRGGLARLVLAASLLAVVGARPHRRKSHALQLTQKARQQRAKQEEQPSREKKNGKESSSRRPVRCDAPLECSTLKDAPFNPLLEANCSRADSFAIVHAGFAKTGTSYIQSTLRKNSEWLRSQSVLYPSLTAMTKASFGHHFLARFLSNESNFPQKEDSTAGCSADYADGQLVQNLVTELACSPCSTRVLISSEDFSTLKPASMEMAGRVLQRRIHVVLFYRNMKDFIVSMYSQQLRNSILGGDAAFPPEILGRTGSLKEYLSIHNPKMKKADRYGRLGTWMMGQVRRYVNLYNVTIVEYAGAAKRGDTADALLAAAGLPKLNIADNPERAGIRDSAPTSLGDETVRQLLPYIVDYAREEHGMEIFSSKLYGMDFSTLPIAKYERPTEQVSIDELRPQAHALDEQMRLAFEWHFCPEFVDQPATRKAISAGPSVFVDLNHTAIQEQLDEWKPRFAELLHFLPPKFELRPLRKHGHDESRTKVQSVFGTEVS